MEHLYLLVQTVRTLQKIGKQVELVFHLDNNGWISAQYRLSQISPAKMEAILRHPKFDGFSVEGKDSSLHVWVREFRGFRWEQGKLILVVNSLNMPTWEVAV